MSENINICEHCKIPICGRQIVLNMALGYIERFLCMDCLALENNRSANDMFTYLLSYIQRRPCFQIEWDKVITCPVSPSQCKQYSLCFG